jgi:hypothetical protein
MPGDGGGKSDYMKLDFVKYHLRMGKNCSNRVGYELQSISAAASHQVEERR